MAEPLEGLTLDQLRVLRAVAREGNFSAAARKLGRVQSAVSQSMDRLEEQLGLRLFDRSSRVPTLTRHGTAIVEAAERIHGDMATLDELIVSLKAGAETRLEIVVDAIFPTSALVGFARDFAAEHPTVELVLHTETLSAVTALVRDKRASFGIAGADASFEGLDRQHLTHVRMMPVAAPDHPLAKLHGPIATADLTRTVQIVLSERNAQSRSEEDHGVLSRSTWRVVDLATKHALIAGGLGWGNMPEHVVRDDLHDGRLVPLHIAPWSPDEYRLSLSIVRREGAVSGPVCRWAETRLVQLCRAELAEPKAGGAGGARGARRSAVK